jgi:hypothetical protein
MAKEIYLRSQKVGVWHRPKTSGQWETAADSGAGTSFINLPAEVGSLSLNHNVVIGNLNTVGSQSMMEESDKVVVDDMSQLKSLPVRMPMTKQLLGYLAPLFMFKAVEVNSTPFQKTFTFAYLGTSPVIDFTTDGGYIADIAFEVYKLSSASNESWILRRAIIDTITLTVDFNASAEGRYVWADITFVGTHCDRIGTGFTGTWTVPAETYINANELFELDIAIAGNAIGAITKVRKFSITFNNQASTDCITNRPENLKINPTTTVEINIPHFDTEGYDLFTDAYRAGTMFRFIASTDGISSGTLGYLSIATGTTSNLLLTSEPLENVGDYGGIKISGKLIRVPGEVPITITVADGIDRNYPLT